MPTSIPIGAPIWSDSMTADLDKEVDFYKQIFGWEAEDSGEEFFHYHTFSKDGRPVMGLSPILPGMEPTKTWNVHFHVANCDEETERAQKLGGTLLMEPMDVGEEIRFSMLADPKGAPFGLVQPYGHPGFGAWGEENAISWVEYGYDGVPAEAMQYYAELLGWKIATPPWGQDSERPYAAVRLEGGEEFGGCHGDDVDPNEPAQWYTMVRVSDVDATCTRAIELGGTVPGPPMNVPGARIAGIAPPSGTIVSLTQYTE